MRHTVRILIGSLLCLAFSACAAQPKPQPRYQYQPTPLAQQKPLTHPDIITPTNKTAGKQALATHQAKEVAAEMQRIPKSRRHLVAQHKKAAMVVAWFAKNGTELIDTDHDGGVKVLRSMVIPGKKSGKVVNGKFAAKFGKATTASNSQESRRAMLAKYKKAPMIITWVKPDMSAIAGFYFSGIGINEVNLKKGELTLHLSP